MQTPSLNPVTPQRVPWTTRDAIVGTVLTLGPLLVLDVFNALAASNGGGTVPKLTPQQDLTAAILTFIITAVLEGVFLIAPLYYARRRAAKRAVGQAMAAESLPLAQTQSPAQALGLRGFNPGLALGLLLLSLAGFYALSAAYDAIATKLRITAPTNLDQLTQQLHQEPLVIYATLIAAVVVAPICEEIFFRGFLLPGLQRSMPAWLAIGLSSLIFAAAHASPGSFALLFILAIFLGILRVATNSIWPGVILHTLNNALGLILVFTMK
jgi:membrane protease YdiL (CAAX protease family)